jgi:cytochrome c oxidase subunit 1
MALFRQHIIPCERRITTARLFAVAFVLVFALGTLADILMAASPGDLPIHSPYFVVAYQQYVLFTSGLMGLFAAIYYLFPKLFGRLMNEALGKIHFVLTFIAGNWIFFPMDIFRSGFGVALEPRRYDYPTGLGWLGWSEPPLYGPKQHVSLSVVLLAVAQLVLLVNFLYSLFWRPSPVQSRERVP